MKRLYPALFALYPVLWIASTSTGAFGWPDLLLLLAIAALTALVLQALLMLVLPRRLPPDLAPLLTCACIAWFFGAVRVAGWLSHERRATPPVGIALAAVLVTIAALWWLARVPPRMTALSRFLGIVGILLVVQATVVVFLHQRTADRTVRTSRVVQALAAPVPAPPSPSRAPRRDVYVLLLDMYANSAVLRHEHGFDNTPFEDSLRTLGFTIPAVVRSNYTQTLLSLPSFLNFSHLTGLTDDLGPNASDVTVPLYLLEHNRSAAFLQARGYRYLFFPSAWWRGSERSRIADAVFDGWSPATLRETMSRTELRRVVWHGTALKMLVPGEIRGNLRHPMRTFEALGQVPEDTALTFAFAHFLLPHPPYVFTAECEPIPGTDLAPTPRGWAGTPEAKRAYVAQLQCLNRHVLALVRTLLTRSAVPPIIILQGDHGTDTENPTDRLPPFPAQLREKTGAFGAYYLPDGGDRLFADSVTVVNVMRNVLSHYFGAELPPESNDLYYSSPDTPYTFRHFTAAEILDR